MKHPPGRKLEILNQNLFVTQSMYRGMDKIMATVVRENTFLY
jgi:hypothetical protein